MPGSRPPTIGLTTISIAPAGDQGSPRLGQNKTYIQAVIRAGGLPLLIPHLDDMALLRAVFERLDGLLLPGGEDIHPGHFGQAIHERCRSISPERDATELPLARWAVEEGKPVLGICRGIQVLNVALGGSLYQDIGSQCPGAGRHDWYPGFPRHLRAHGASVVDGTRLAGILQAATVEVNSLHHQSIKDVAPALEVAAVAPDGIIEAVEVRDHPFALAAQWHPEELAATEAASQRLFDALVRSGRGEWLQTFFRLFTILGNEEFYLFLLPTIYWCLSRRVGIGLGYLSMFSTWANNVVKYTFDIPRPADSRLRVPWPETSPSFPSGHSQSAVTNWGYLALQLRRGAWILLAVLLMLMISLSRMVLGVHFPQDLIGGWAIGLVVLLAFAWAEPRIASWLGRQQVGLKATMAVAFPLLLIFLHPADSEGLYPAEAALTPASALVGMGLGIIMERAWVRFDVGGPWSRRLLRLALGLVVVVVVYAGPKLLLPADMAHAAESIARFLRYALLGWVIACGCPWLFVKLGLAPREGEPAGAYHPATSSL